MRRAAQRTGGEPREADAQPYSIADRDGLIVLDGMLTLWCRAARNAKEWTVTAEEAQLILRAIPYLASRSWIRLRRAARSDWPCWRLVDSGQVFGITRGGIRELDVFRRARRAAVRS